jgi:hypothetical protein
LFAQPGRTHTSVPCSLAAFGAWLARARPGERLEYYRGFLAIDRVKDTSALKEPERLKLAAVADQALALADLGKLHSPNNISIWGLYPISVARYRRKGQRGAAAKALVRADLTDPRAILESLVGELTEFHLERPSDSPAGARAHEPAGPAQRPLPPLAAALSAEGQLLATLPPDGRPPDMLGMARVIKLKALATAAAGAEWAAVA